FSFDALLETIGSRLWQMIVAVFYGHYGHWRDDRSSTRPRRLNNGTMFQTTSHLFNGYLPLFGWDTQRRGKFQNGITRYPVEDCRGERRGDQLAVHDEHYIHDSCLVDVFMLARIGPQHLVESFVAGQQGGVKRTAVIAGALSVSCSAFSGADKMVFDLHAQGLAKVRPDRACHDDKQIFI